MKIAAILSGVLVVIVTITVLMGVIGGTSDSLQNATNSVTAVDNNCSSYLDTEGTAYYFNQTTQTCYNSSPAGSQNWGTVDFSNTLPLTALFSTSGVVMIVLMASLLLAIIGIVLYTLVKR